MGEYELPLSGAVVLDLSQYLAGPSAATRLADLGARVIKIERPGTGEGGRSRALSNQTFDQDSILFHTINRNKESLTVDLKDDRQLAELKHLVKEADVVVESFRPGALEQFGLDYASASSTNRRLVYASVTGYGTEGPWRDRPGQDLLIQALSGVVWLNGTANEPPLPLGLSVIDTIAGAHLCQGILACLVRRAVTGRGARVEVSLLESALDLAYEPLTQYLNGDGSLPQRSNIAGAHPGAAAPYGVYQTADGFIALAMGSVPLLGDLIGLRDLCAYTEPASWQELRDEIKMLLSTHMVSKPTKFWLDILLPAGYWCAEVLRWPDLMSRDGFKALGMLQELRREDLTMQTTRCPIRIDGRVLRSSVPGPRLGEHEPLPGAAS